MTLRKRVDRAGAEAVARGRRALAEGLVAPPEGSLLFVTISGAHLYGFPSPDSDLDLRGMHVLPLETVVGLRPPTETWESSTVELDGVPLDCVTHDVRKYLTLMSGRNGYILEQVFSPLVVHDDGRLGEVRRLAAGSLTSGVVHHYRGFFRSQERLVERADPPMAKHVLYLFRVAMTGLYLLRERIVETDILRLDEAMFGLGFVADLVERKMSGGERSRLEAGEVDALLADARRLEAELEPAAATSGLPGSPPNLDEIGAFLGEVRLRGWRRG